MSDLQEQFKLQMELRLLRRSVDDQLEAQASDFLAAFPGLNNNFQQCVTRIAAAKQLGFEPESDFALEKASEYLRLAEEAWHSEPIQDLRSESNRDITRGLDTPKELRYDLRHYRPLNSSVEAATEMVGQMRSCVHCLDALNAMLIEILKDKRSVLENLYFDNWN